METRILMNQRTTRSCLALCAAAVAMIVVMLSQPAIAFAQDLSAQDASSTGQNAVSYDYNATPYSPATGQDVYPGVYEAKLQENSATTTADNPQTIGIPSIADANLADAPTTESPAIIQGAAVGYEEKTGATEYKVIKERDEPYSEFKYSIMEEKGQDGTVHKKLTGFDGTYVIVRLDVEDIFSGVAPEDLGTTYLHMKQEDNQALLVDVGMNAEKNTFTGLTATASGDGVFKAGGIYRTGAYLLSELKDAINGSPFIDVILFATASNVAGADAGKEGARNGNVPLHFYLDKIKDYNPSLVYDPQSTDPNHVANCLKKFYDETKAVGAKVSNYVVKGSDLALETMVENSGGADGTATTYWSLHKSMEKPYYDQEIDKSPNDPNCGRTVKLMSEVAVIDTMDLEGTYANNLKKRTLDVNSFDIQVAKNSASDNTGFILKNAWLKIADLSKTTGAEFAIGNNAKMVIDQGGKLIIDETCQLEVEWDGGTTAPGQKADTLGNGSIDLRTGGEIENNGVISIEGTEGKPLQPGTSPPTERGYGEFTIRQGATLTNNGTMVVNGRLYNLGTLVNNGKYDDVIVSNDPDKGRFEYHRGIQVGWKDDVTQPGVMMGELHNGQDRTGATFVDALLRNIGDILLAPGKLLNYSTIINEAGAHIYLAAAEEAIIPIEPDPAAPTVTYKRIKLNSPVGSVIENHGTIINRGEIVPASVELLDNTGYGKLTVPGNHPELFKLLNYGTIINEGFIWGWGTPGMDGNDGLANTGDELALGLIAGALAAFAASSALLVLAHRRLRSR